jgi:hypothetical protein
MVWCLVKPKDKFTSTVLGFTSLSTEGIILNVEKDRIRRYSASSSQTWIYPVLLCLFEADICWPNLSLFSNNPTTFFHLFQTLLDILILQVMRAICKVHGLTLLLWVGALWRCGDGLFFEVPPLASDTLLTTLHPLLKNVLQTVDHFEILCLGAPFSWLEKLRNHMGWDLNWILCSAWKKWINGTPLGHLPYSTALAPCDFWAFPTMKSELWGKKFQSDQWSAARFQEVGGAL